MTKGYEQMTRGELLDQLQRHGLPQEEISHLQHELEIHQGKLSDQSAELKQTQTMLDASRNEYVNLYDQAPVPYLTFNPHGSIVAINLTGCELLDMERARILDMPFSSFIAAPYRLQFLDHMRRCRESVEQISTELELISRAGVKIPALLVSRRAEGNTFRTIIFNRTEQLRLDDTIRALNTNLEQRVKERTIELERTNARLQTEVDQREVAEKMLKEAHRRKDEFLAMLGHELRNPLGPIRNSASFLQAIAQDRPELQEVAETIERQVRHMGRIIDDLLDVSRISQGKIKLVRQPVQLNALIREVINDQHHFAEAHRLKLEVDLPDNPVWIQGDSVRVSQVIGNLLHNACKFTDAEGTITVRLRALPNLHEAVITIADTGIGIDPELLSRIFTAFSQADRSLDRTLGGLGLGLALVQGLVELHGGSVHVTSPGTDQGSTFTVRLPLIEPPDGESDGREPSPISAEPASRSLKILVIDDQRDAILTMRRLLERMGHDVNTAANGEEGIELARELHPQVVISDIGLPGMSGYDIARAIRQDATIGSPYLIALTGYGQDDDMRRALAAGFDRHIVKPVAFRDLEQILSSVSPA